MNKKQMIIWGQILKEKAKDRPDKKILTKLAKDMERYQDDDLEFLGETNDAVYRGQRSGARCYRFAKWYCDDG